jgi:hypothetical protein
MGSDEPSLERPGEARRDNRERTFLPAKISFGDGALSAECMVTQLSATGARLNVSPNFSLPDRFDFAIPQRAMHRRARLVWRKNAQAGIEFDAEDAQEVDDIGFDYRAKIRELEAANAKLRAQVAELLLQVQRLTDQ